MINPVIGPFKLLARDQRTFKIQRGAVVERFNSERVTKAPTSGKERETEEGNLDATHMDVVSKCTEE